MEQEIRTLGPTRAILLGLRVLLVRERGERTHRLGILGSGFGGK